MFWADVQTCGEISGSGFRRVDLDSRTRRRKNGGFRSPPPPPPLADGRCEASAATAALGEPRGTLYCALLLLLPSRCIPVRFDCARGRGGATPTGVAAPCAPAPRTQYAARHGAVLRLGRVASMERSGKSLPLTVVFRRLAGLPSHNVQDKRIRLCRCVFHMLMNSQSLTSVTWKPTPF